jgi:syntaxin-binding protein 5
VTGIYSPVLAVGGPDRPPSKRMMEQLRLEEVERRKAAREGRLSGNSTPENEEGYWANMQRQVQERTQKLGMMGDSMDKLEENSSNWASDVNKFIQTQKRKAVLGGKVLSIFSILHSVRI